MTPKQLLGAFEALADTPDAIERLRELVLAFAVTGKLVPQDANDEPACVLVERIESGKATLSRERRSPPSRHGARPDARIPAGWANVALGKVIDLRYGKALPERSRMGGRIPVFGSNGKIGVHGVANVEVDCIVVGRKGSIGAVNRTLGPAWVIDTAYYVIPPDGLTPDFLALVLKWLDLAQHDKATAIPGLNRNDVYEQVVGIPPTSEQHRIVACANELMTLLGQFDAAQAARETARAAARDSALTALREASGPEDMNRAWARLRDRFDTLFTDPVDAAPLRETILQLAIRGKLVSQDEGDEPAEELLRRIRESKPALSSRKARNAIRVGRPVEGEGLGFELPPGWVTCELGDLVVDGPVNGLSPRPGDPSTGVRSLTLSATTRGRFDATQFKWVDLRESEVDDLWLRPGDLLIQRSNTPEYVGIAAVFNDAERTFIFPDLMMRMRLSTEVCLRYGISL